VNAAGKLWIVNGVDFVKVENDLSVYRVQLEAPASGSVVAVSGGALADGVYDVYSAYARVNNNGQYLYSLPLSLGTVTLGSGNNMVTVTIPDSTDSQVNRKIVFMTDVGGSVPYFYAEGMAIVATIDVSDTSGRNDDIQMSTYSAANQILPINPNSIYYFNERLYVWVKNTRTLYWSVKNNNLFDLERYYVENFREIGLSINSIFNVGADLFINCIGNGTLKIPLGDLSSSFQYINRNLWFLDCKTPEGKSNVVFHKGLAFGLTNDGFRFFDGSSFSEDLSFHIKPDVDNIYRGGTGDYLPCAIVNRRSGKRTEYRFSYRNLNYGSLGNNDQRIFNLDYYFDPVQSRKTWECWENGFSGMVVINNAWYGSQSYPDGAQIVSESGVSDINCYDRTGTFQTVLFKKQLYQLSKTVIDDLDAITVWGPVYALANSIGTITGNVIVFDLNYRKFAFSILGAPPSTGVLPSDISGLGLPIPFVMNPQYPVGSCDPISFECRGNSVSIEISQIEDDIEFFLYKLQLPRAKQVKHNLT
jgi:hypothetical protein